jgi:hypothetical protein
METDLSEENALTICERVIAMKMEVIQGSIMKNPQYRLSELSKIVGLQLSLFT